jgi:hypothetical protein
MRASGIRGHPGLLRRLFTAATRSRSARIKFGIELQFVCTACGKKYAEVRPDFDWNRSTLLEDTLHIDARKPSMKYANRPFADLEKATRELIEVGNAVGSYPETKKKDVVFSFADIWTPFNGDRGTKSKPIPGPHLVYGFLTTSPNTVVEPIRRGWWTVRVSHGGLPVGSPTGFPSRTFRWRNSELICSIICARSPPKCERTMHARCLLLGNRQRTIGC